MKIKLNLTDNAFGVTISTSAVVFGIIADTLCLLIDKNDPKEIYQKEFLKPFIKECRAVFQNKAPANSTVKKINRKDFYDMIWDVLVDDLLPEDSPVYSINVPIIVFIVQLSVVRNISMLCNQSGKNTWAEEQFLMCLIHTFLETVRLADPDISHQCGRIITNSHVIFHSGYLLYHSQFVMGKYLEETEHRYNLKKLEKHLASLWWYSQSYKKYSEIISKTAAQNNYDPKLLSVKIDNAKINW